MTHKIKVQMFGNFRMDYNGAPFVAEKMHKESQFNRMMQALIHYSDCGIAKDKLEEIVIGERDIDAPHTALRVIVYKTKQKLAQLGLPGKNLIYLEGGIYYWTPDIEIEEDAAEFEKLYNEACALEKQMPQEPESAETVCDERIKEIEDNMLELYVKALYLYKGEFLAAYTGETWIAQEARRYHTMFEKIVNEAAYILRKRKQFKRLEKLGVYAAKVDPFMVNIVSGMMTMFTGKPLEKLALPVAIGVAEIAVMIVLETTEKRIAVQRVSINNIYADKNYIAYKLNPVGATPLMFASAAFLLPQFMCNGLHYLFPDNADIQWWMDNMRLTSPLGIVVYMVIICLLTIIFSMVMLSPGRTADDLLKSGDSIQDIYAGKSTKRYLIGTVLSFSVISSIIICICQGGPLFLQFGGYVDASLAMLPCSIMMTTGLWISLYREAEVYRNMDRYHTFI